MTKFEEYVFYENINEIDNIEVSVFGSKIQMTMNFFGGEPYGCESQTYREFEEDLIILKGLLGSKKIII